MKFVSKAPKSACKIRFIEGAVSKYTGKEVHVATGQDSKATPSKTKESPLNRRKYALLMRKVVNVAKQNKLKALEVSYKDLRALAPKTWSDSEVGRVAAEAFVMADYEYVAHKSKPKDGWSAVDVVAVTGIGTEAAKGFKKGHRIADAVNAAREWANTPGGDMTPTLFAEAARKAARGTGAEVKILGRAAMEELGMGAILGVAKGSGEEPKFIIVEYWGASKPVGQTYGRKSDLLAPVVLIGKGVTFDTGGLNIKTGEHMYEMHMDMSGGAAVIQATLLAARMGLKVNVVALVPAVENHPGHGAVRPGDVLRSLSGKTIEILNTDAEGRVILADAITYAKRYRPAEVAEVSTLTGAALTVMGQVASVYMTNDEARIPEYQHAGEASGDYVWPLPQWEEYEEMTKGTFADVPNISTMGNSRHGGVIAGGMFLWQFAKELACPWIHIDMASRMTSYPGEFLSRGAAGAPVRFLYALIEKHANRG